VPATGERVGQAGTIITLPSPDLAPEEGHTVEAGLRWHGRRRATSVTAFRSEYSNLIQSVPVTPTQRQARNVGEARISGIEVDGQARVAERWSGRYTVSAIRGTNRTTGVPLPSLAPFAARAAIRYEGQAGWYAETGLAAFRGTTRIDSAQERPRPGYATVDTYAGMRLDRWAGSRWGRWRLIGGVTNLLDQAGRNPASTEDVAFSNTLLSNPLYEPGRAFVLKLSSSY
jgi:hemoglobin/transferrin/lactoferrin receptor protein